MQKEEKYSNYTEYSIIIPAACQNVMHEHEHYEQILIYKLNKTICYFHDKL